MRDDQQIRIEFEALSLLCHHWASRTIAGKDTIEWNDKLDKFNDAVITGMGSGAMEELPFEFVADEYEVVYEAIKKIETNWKNYNGDDCLSEWLKNSKVSFEVEKQEIKLPCPWSPSRIESRLGGDKTATPSSIARGIVSWRLPGKSGLISSDAVKADIILRRKGGSREVRPPLPKLSFAKILLLHVFFDLSTDSGKQAKLWKGRILDLISKEYPPIAIYYLIIVSDRIDERIYTGEYDFSEIEKLYKCVKSEIIDGPFTQLTQARLNTSKRSAD